MGQRAKTVNLVSGDVVAEAGRRGAATKGPALSSLGDLGGPGEVEPPRGSSWGGSVLGTWSLLWGPSIHQHT